MPTFVFYPPGITLKIIAMDLCTHRRSFYIHHIWG